MKRKILLQLCLLLLLAAPLYGNSVQDFSFTDITGKTYRWEDIKGKPLVVNIGSHW